MTAQGSCCCCCSCTFSSEVKVNSLHFFTMIDDLAFDLSIFLIILGNVHICGPHVEIVLYYWYSMLTALFVFPFIAR